jgi:hypothetical protein
VRFVDAKEAAGPREVEWRMVLRVPVESMIEYYLFTLIRRLLLDKSVVVSFAKIMRGVRREGWIDQ